MLKNLRTVFLFAILMAVSSSVVLAQSSSDRVVTGTVIDEDGGTLPGASVMVQGTKLGTTSDSDGKFTLSVPSDTKALVINFIGMSTEELILGVKSSYRVTLKSTTSKLNEVVVIGYGTTKRANLTTAQTTVSNKELNRTVNTTIEQAIQGRSAGVYVTQNSGQPGGGISVQIRGVNTIFGSTEPLYVIDGIQIPGGQIGFGAQSSSNPLSGINPADIEDIQVLQGPSATAIYGSRATNGVLLITTKRGKAGDVKINYGFKYNIQSAPERLSVMTLSQYAQMVKEYHVIAGGETQREFMDPSLLGQGTDWQKELFKSTPMANHSLSLSGGSEKTTYYLSGDYLDQKGVAAGSGFKRSSFRLNLDNKPKEWLKIGSNINFRQTNEILTTSQENVISNALQLSPQVPVKNLDGSWGGGDPVNGANIFAPVNPVAIASLTTNTFQRREFTGDVNADIKIFKDLHFRTSFNTSLGFHNSTLYRPTYKLGWNVNPTASYNNGANNNTYYNFNQLLEYNKQLKKHTFSVMASHENQASSWKNSSSGRTGYLTNEVFDVNAGDALTSTNSGGNDDQAMESYLGRVNYNYDDRYVLTGSVRTDGSSFFGPGNKWGVFPAFSAAWRVSKEKFFNIPAISDFKLRFETGKTGNQGWVKGAFGPLNAAPSPTGPGFLLGRYGNPYTQWEETSTNNFGLNIGLIKNRFEIEADYYIKNTNNLLMESLLPWYMGSIGTGAISPPLVNVGALQTKGWGLTFNTQNIVSKDFKWSTNLNFSHYSSKITKFNSDRANIQRTSWWLNNWTQKTVIGEEPWLFRGYIEEGLFQSEAEINASAVPVDGNKVRYPTSPAGIWVGDVKYKDISGPDGVPDGKIDGNDETNIGNPWPELFGGLTNDFTYKGFNLSVLLTSTTGNDVYNYMALVNSNPNNINLSRNMLTQSMGYARPVAGTDGKVSLENPGTDVARISLGPNDNYGRFTTKWVEDGSFVRLKNVSLSYNLPARLMSRQKLVRNVRMTVGAQNLLTITGYKGFDPEVGSYVGRDASASNQAVGLDFGRYPLTRIYTFSLGMDF